MHWHGGSVGLAGALVLGAILSDPWTAPALAHETDNFSKPPEQRFADWGVVWTRIVHRNLEAAVTHVNERIRLAETGDRPTEDLDALRDGATVQRAVRRAFPPTLTFIDEVDRMVATPQARRRFPGQLTYYEPFEYIYSHSSFPLDPRQVFKLWRAAHMKVAGVYLGSDKLGHFFTKGDIYYRMYREKVDAGMDRDEAIDAVVAVGVGDDLFLSEKRMLGYWSSGVLSHADLAADYLGLMFYINLTEPVHIAGRTRPPMLEQINGYWRLADHVRRDTDFFTVYVSDHWDEALNPNLMEPMMRHPVRIQIEKGCAPLLERHADRFGNRRSRRWFETRMRELSTYEGRYYGHQQRFEDMVAIPQVCFPAHDFTGSDDRSPLGRTALHQAVIDGDIERMRALLVAGADVNAEVRSREDYSSAWGDRPLHYAVREARPTMVRELLEHGAEPSAANDRGVTPLHRATQLDGDREVMELLLDAGADVLAPDEQGRAPLHWAATYPRVAVIERLLDAGADARARDHAQRVPMHHAATWGQAAVIEALAVAGASAAPRAAFGVTPMHEAARAGQGEAIVALLAAGAAPAARDDIDRTPLHEAAAHTHSDAARVLLEADAPVHARDAFGATALHEAARDDNVYLIGVLIDAGGDPNARDHLGQTPLHVAAQRNHETALETLIERNGDATRTNHRDRTPRVLLENARPNLVDYFTRLGSLHNRSLRDRP